MALSGLETGYLFTITAERAKALQRINLNGLIDMVVMTMIIQVYKHFLSSLVFAVSIKN